MNERARNMLPSLRRGPWRGGAFLQKPFTAEAPERKGREVLDEVDTDAYQVPIMHIRG